MWAWVYETRRKRSTRLRGTVSRWPRGEAQICKICITWVRLPPVTLDSLTNRLTSPPRGGTSRHAKLRLWCLIWFAGATPVEATVTMWRKVHKMVGIRRDLDIPAPEACEFESRHSHQRPTGETGKRAKLKPLFFRGSNPRSVTNASCWNQQTS